jgi:putative transcriptional regulator
MARSASYPRAAPSLLSIELTMNKTADRRKPAEDWDRFEAMSVTARRAAALADPDAKPLAAEDFKRMRRAPQIKIVRRALGLS